jgi:hypothetical protein
VNIFGLPIGAKPGDPVVGEVDGKPVYMTPDGRRYYEPAYEPQAPAVLGEALKTSLDSQGRAVHDRTPYRPPGEGGRAIVEALMGEAWRGVAAPGRALRGEPVTYGDAWATASDWGVGSAHTSAPKGAVRAGPMRTRVYRGQPEEFADMPVGRWFTDDPEHAGYFGDVKQYDITAKNVLDVDARNPASSDDIKSIANLLADRWGQDPEDVMGYIEDRFAAGGYDLDDMLGDMVTDTPFDAIRADNLEGMGKTYLLGGKGEAELAPTGIVEIVRKYGIAGAAAALGMTNEEIQQRLNNAGLHSRP